MTRLGPTPTPLDLAGRKLLALFSRAEARDFADVFLLARTFGKSTMMRQAAITDAGFDRLVLAEMLAAHVRLSDDEIPVPDSIVAELREYFTAWREELLQHADPSCESDGDGDGNI